MPHPKKQGEETTENRKEGSARAQATAWAEIAARSSEPTFPVLASEQTEATPALPSHTLDRLNAQRRCNGKGALTPRDLAQLNREATQAGLTPLDAVQWVLAKPQRNFFKADFYAPPVARRNAAPCSVQAVMAPVAAPHPTAQHPATPVMLKQAHATASAPASTNETETQLHTREPENGNVHERVRELLAQLPNHLHHHHSGGNGNHTTGHTSPARDTRWASAAVEQFVAGHAVSHYRLKVACEVLGIDLRALRQRTMAGTA